MQGATCKPKKPTFGCASKDWLQTFDKFRLRLKKYTGSCRKHAEGQSIK